VVCVTLNPHAKFEVSISAFPDILGSPKIWKVGHVTQARHSFYVYTRLAWLDNPNPTKLVTRTVSTFSLSQSRMGSPFPSLPSSSLSFPYPFLLFPHPLRNRAPSNQLGGQGSAVSSPSGVSGGAQPKTNLVHSVRKPQLAIILSTQNRPALLRGVKN